MDWLFAFKSTSNQTHLIVPRGANAKAKWRRNGVTDSKKAKCFDAAKIKRWFNFLVDNIFLQFSQDHILRQRIGIPMGTNCAVFIANMFCFTYEFDFISRLIAAQRVDILSIFCTHYVLWMICFHAIIQCLRNICTQMLRTTMAFKVYTLHSYVWIVNKKVMNRYRFWMYFCIRHAAFWPQRFLINRSIRHCRRLTKLNTHTHLVSCQNAHNTA